MISITRRALLGLALLGSVLVASNPTAQGASSFKVVVNSSNPVSSLSKEEVSKLLMKRTRRWDDGGKAKPADQVESSAVRQAFSMEVHGKDVKDVKGYWATKIFSGSGSPPPEFSSDEKVLSYIRSNAGAIGYVSAGAALGTGVKVIELTE